MWEMGFQESPLRRFGHSAVIYGSSMYIFGGWNGHDTMDDLSEFNTTTLQWSRPEEWLFQCCLENLSGFHPFVRRSRISHQKDHPNRLKCNTKVEMF